MRPLLAGLTLIVGLSLFGPVLGQDLDKLKAERAAIEAKIAALQKKEPPPAEPAKFPTGRVEPPKAVAAAMRAAAVARNGQRVALLPKSAPAKFDCREMGWTPPIKDQGNCGSCYWFSGLGAGSAAYWKAGYKDQIGNGLSEQAGLDCHPNQGGCNGGWEADVVELAMKTGLPTEADYGPYRASPGNCKSGKKLWKIKDWGYCDPANPEGVASVQSIKNAMVQFGEISVAVAADDRFMNYQAGTVFSGNGTSINHAVALVAWDDTKVPGKTVWTLRNSWGRGWGNDGYMDIVAGSNKVGSDALWAFVDPLAPDPPPPPGTFAVTISDATVQVGVPHTFVPVITGGTAPITWSLNFGDGGTGTSLTHTYTMAGTFPLAFTAIDAKGALASGTASVVVGTKPPPPPPPVPGTYATITVSGAGPSQVTTIVGQFPSGQSYVIPAGTTVGDLLNPRK